MLKIPRFPWQLYIDILRFPWQLYLQYTPPKKEKIDGLIMSSESNNFFYQGKKSTNRNQTNTPVQQPSNRNSGLPVINPEKTISFDSANGRFPSTRTRAFTLSCFRFPFSSDAQKQNSCKLRTRFSPFSRD